MKESEADLSRSDTKRLNEACFELSQKGILHYMGLIFLVINIPGVTLCDTIYHMDIEGASYFTVVILSVIFYAVAISLFYALWFLRTTH